MFKTIKYFLLALTCSVSAFADEPHMTVAKDGQQVFVDAEGRQHGLGYLGQGAVHGVVHWAPKIRRSFPEKMDGRELGWSPSIKNQGSCGSCWAFSITRAHESARLKKGKAYLDLSEQEMVSCADAYGCGGGYMSNMSYVKDNGQALESDWRYTASNGRCKNPKPARASKAIRWGYVGSENRKPTLDEVKQAFTDFGELSAEVAAGGAFSPNSQGYITSCGSRSINHMVTIAGWKENDVLILGNSWGTSWGDDGYAYTKLGCNLYGNRVTWVEVEGDGPAPKVPNVRLPAEISVLPGTELMLGVRPEAGVTYAWFKDGVKIANETSSMLYVSPDKDTVYKLTGTTAAGVAESSVLVKVKAD